MPVLETRSLRLRPYGEADRRPFVALVSDEDLMGRLGGPVPSPNTLFEHLLRHNPEAGELAWAITLRAAKGLIGHIWLQGLCADSLPQLGFVLQSSYAGRGLATEAAEAVLRHGISALRLAGIEATVDPDHVASQRVLEKSGMRIAREERDAEGRYLVYSSAPRAP